ncbi:MAG: hypothetical protein AB8H79_23055 [Myxococcota bacterium]
MTQDEAPNSVADALAAAENMRREAESRHQQQLSEFDEEVSRLEQAVANLTAQLDAVRESRAQSEAAHVAAGSASAGEAYHLVFATLRAQSDLLAARNDSWSAARRAIEAQVTASLHEGDLAELVSDYEDARKDSAALANLPATYRKVVMEHHQAIEDRLRDKLAALDKDPALDGEQIEIDVVVAVDGDDEGGVAMVVSPVPEEAHGAWEGRDADLLTAVAARLVQGIYTTVRGTEFEAIQAAFGGHQGLLAMEVELMPEQVAGFQETLVDAVDRIMSEASELRGARISVKVTPVPVDLLLPPEGEEGDHA